MERSEILERAADKIEREGWKQGAISFDDGRGVCAGNAIAFSHYSLSRVTAAQRALSEALPLPCLADRLRYSYAADYMIRVYAWNDAPGRTKEEVCAMLMAVSASLRAAARTAGTRQPVAASTDAGVDGGSAALMERVS